jgi:hypothetical protein
VKITVIATGFGQPAAARTPASAAPTPVDMTQYGDHGRLRADGGSTATPSLSGAMDRMSQSRLSIARRPLLDLSLAAPANASGTAPDEAAGAAPPAGAGAIEGELNPDFDLSTTFDVPAFLRRQEG